LSRLAIRRPRRKSRSEGLRDASSSATDSATVERFRVRRQAEAQVCMAPCTSNGWRIQWFAYTHRFGVPTGSAHTNGLCTSPCWLKRIHWHPKASNGTDNIKPEEWTDWVVGSDLRRHRGNSRWRISRCLATDDWRSVLRYYSGFGAVYTMGHFPTPAAGRLSWRFSRLWNSGCTRAHSQA